MGIEHSTKQINVQLNLTISSITWSPAGLDKGDLNKKVTVLPVPRFEFDSEWNVLVIGQWPIPSESECARDWYQSTASDHAGQSELFLPVSHRQTLI